MDSGGPKEKQVRDETATTLKQDVLIKLFSENWAHIRHMEYYRMWGVNIYAVVVAGLAYALSTEKLEPYLSHTVVFLVLFTILNLLITLKIGAVINNFVQANERIAAQLRIKHIAPIRTREGRVASLIRFGWIFPAFYLFALAGIIVMTIIR